MSSVCECSLAGQEREEDNVCHCVSNSPEFNYFDIFNHIAVMWLVWRGQGCQSIKYMHH